LVWLEENGIIWPCAELAGGILDVYCLEHEEVCHYYGIAAQTLSGRGIYSDFQMEKLRSSRDFADSKLERF